MSYTPCYMALVHHPVLNKHGDKITTAITNLDVHDGCRMAATFGLERFFLISPIEEQRALVTRITSHWVNGPGAKKNPTRTIAMSKAVPAATLAEACTEIERIEGKAPLLIGTSARRQNAQHISYRELRMRRLHPTSDSRPLLLTFGTGWGLAPDLTPTIELMLPPIQGPTSYNHLSVRAAMAITLDRILSTYHEDENTSTT